MKDKICVSQSILLTMLMAACGVSIPPSAAAPTASATPTATTLQLKGSWLSLTWYGQAAFLLTTSSGLTALLDPTGPGAGYQLPTFENVDLATASHEHSDHNAVGFAAGSPLILKGLTGGDWATIDQTVKGVRIRTVGVYHDAQQGAQRGKDAVFVFECDGLRLAHLGDLGHSLTPEQVKAIGPLDVLLIPVGGYYTVDAKTAVEVIGQLQPIIVIPMHHKTPDLAASLAAVLAPVDDFLKAVGDQADVIQAGQTTTIEKDKLPARRTIIVMKYKP